jgi:bifunctional DNase/RNase
MTEVSILRLVQHWSATPGIGVVILEKNGKRRLVFFVDVAVGNAIVHALGKIPHPRPLTHDLFTSAIASFNVKLRHVIIHDWKDGMFYAKIVLDHPGGTTELDSRPSDAVALAVATEAPIFVEDHVFGECGAQKPPASIPPVSILWPFAKPPPLQPSGDASSRAVETPPSA